MSSLPPAVTFVKQGPATVNAGQTATYTLTATNTGPTATDPVVITDTLPAGFFVQSATFGTPTAPCAVTGVAATGQTVTCAGPTGVTIPLGGSLTANITAIASVAGTFSNTATLTAPGNGMPNSVQSNAVQTVVTGSLTCFGSAPTILGTMRDDVIDGTPGADVIMGLGGNDTIDGFAGNDKICGDTGNDHLYGGSGDAQVAGGRGSDVVDGGAGRDVVRGGRDQSFPNTTSVKHHGPDGGFRDGNRRGRDHDILICERQDTSCGDGFDRFRSFSTDQAGHHFDGRGDGNDKIIWVPLRDGRDRRGDRGDRGGDFGNRPFNRTAPANKQAPMKPAAKPAEKSAPAVAGTQPVAPKA